jgi:carbonic anhydrase
LKANKSEIFLQAGLDSPNQIESVQQIAVLAHAVCGASRLASQARRRKTIA